MKTYFSLILFLVVINSAFSEGTQKRKDLITLSELNLSKSKDSLAVIDAHITDILNSKQIDTAHIQQLNTQKKIIIDNMFNKVIEYEKEENNKEVQSNFLSISILLFGLFTIGLLLFFIRKNTENNIYMFKLLGVMFIGTITVFLIPAGFSNEQITPIVGLLGTLAGYLVGSSTNLNNNKPS
jgi:hypothetical protein